jgi:hypothetical protein
MSRGPIQRRGLTRTKDHQYRWNDGPLVAGVTSLVKMLDKSGPLMGWAKRETAASAVRNIDTLTEMLRVGGPDAAALWLSRIPDYQRDTAADLGVQVHAFADAMAKGAEFEVDAGVLLYAQGYQRWLDAAKPKRMRAEKMVYSERGYGGTLDLICELDGAVTLLDLKTGKGVYDEVRLQLAAYANADWIGRPDDPRKYRIPAIERFAVLHLRPELYETGYKLIEFDVGEADLEAFLACLRLHQWRASLNGRGS